MNNSTLLSFLSPDASASIAIVIVNAVNIDIERTDIYLKDENWTHHLFFKDATLSPLVYTGR